MINNHLSDRFKNYVIPLSPKDQSTHMHKRRYNAVFQSRSVLERKSNSTIAARYKRRKSIWQLRPHRTPEPRSKHLLVQIYLFVLKCRIFKKKSLAQTFVKQTIDTINRLGGGGNKIIILYYWFFAILHVYIYIMYILLLNEMNFLLKPVLWIVINRLRVARSAVCIFFLLLLLFFIITLFAKVFVRYL